MPAYLLPEAYRPAMAPFAGCCCCTKHPGVVSSAITLLVLVLLMQTYTIWEAVYNAISQGNYYYWYYSVRPISQPWLLLPFDSVAAILLIIAASLLVHASTDRLAQKQRPPFFRCFWLLSLGSSLQFCSFLLGLIDSCVTSGLDWWGSSGCLSIGGYGSIPRAAIFVPAWVCIGFTLHAHLRGTAACASEPRVSPPQASSPVEGIALEEPTSPRLPTSPHISTTDPEAAALPSPSLEPSLPGPDEVPSEASDPKKTLGASSSRARLNPPARPRHSRVGLCSTPKVRGVWRVALFHVCTVAVLVPTLTELTLRKPCPCSNGDCTRTPPGLERGELCSHPGALHTSGCPTHIRVPYTPGCPTRSH